MGQAYLFVEWQRGADDSGHPGAACAFLRSHGGRRRKDLTRNRQVALKRMFKSLGGHERWAPRPGGRFLGDSKLVQLLNHFCFFPPPRGVGFCAAGLTERARGRCGAATRSATMLWPARALPFLWKIRFPEFQYYRQLLCAANFAEFQYYRPHGVIFNDVLWKFNLSN